MAEARGIIDLIQAAIDDGATTVEETHKAIADLPLRILEEVKLLKKPIKEVRKIQDRSIGAVYGLIRDINDQVGQLAADMLKGRRTSAGTRRKPPASARARAKA